MARIHGDRRKSWEDFLVGTSENDWISAGNGNDTVQAGAGSDFVHGGAGNDKLFGGSGFDILIGSLGNDYIDGGADRDQACYSTRTVYAKWVGKELQVWNQHADPAKAAKSNFGDGLDTLVNVELLNLGGYLYRTDEIPNDNKIHLVGVGAEGTCYGHIYDYTGI